LTDKSPDKVRLMFDSGALLCLFSFFFLRYLWLAALAVFFIAAGYFKCGFFTLSAERYFKFLEYTGSLSNRIILFIVFYFIFCPLALFRRFFFCKQAAGFSGRGKESLFDKTGKADFSKGDFKKIW